MIPARVELQARELVSEAINLGGTLWRHVTPATVEMLVEAVALDLRDAEDRQESQPDAPAKITDRDDRSS